MSEIEIGVVQFYSQERRYGFIARENKPDVFVHPNDCMYGMLPLYQGQRVEFVETLGKNGKMHAANVRAISPAPVDMRYED
jgi:CspA family cold shock protein